MDIWRSPAGAILPGFLFSPTKKQFKNIFGAELPHVSAFRRPLNLTPVAHQILKKGERPYANSRKPA